MFYHISQYTLPRLVLLVQATKYALALEQVIEQVIEQVLEQVIEQEREQKR
jgi:hypothetical protein